MLAPAMLVLLALTIFPSAYMFVAAVTRISPNPDTPWQFAGAQNFLKLLTDPQFHIGLWNTLVFTFASVSIEFLLGLGLALLLDNYVRASELPEDAADAADDAAAGRGCHHLEADL